jgi:leader peptidase (prepilin peptidase)/N-methyltransferase
MTEQTAYFVIYAFIFVVGACIGSFMNVVIYRVPIGLSIARGRSFCPACKAPIAAYDNIPLISWLVLRGKCRRCGAPIPMRYFWVELAGGVSAVWMAMHYRLGWLTLTGFAIAVVLIAIAVIDWDHMIIPNGLVIALIVPVMAAYFLNPDPDLVNRLIGIAVGALPLLILAVTLGAFGMGDVRLMAVAGFLLGWKCTLLALFLGVLLGGIVGIVKTLRKTGQKEMAFGPYLCMGILIAMLYGNTIIQSYLSFFGLA